MVIAYLGLCWLLGLLAADFADGDPLAVALAAGLAALAWLALHLPRPLTLLAAVGAGLVLAGAWQYQAAQPAPQPQGIALYSESGAVTFRALVSDEPDQRGAAARLRLSAQAVLTPDGWREISGGVLAYVPAFLDYGYGDLLQVSGRLETPPQVSVRLKTTPQSADFNYRDYLARQGVAAIAYYPKTGRIAAGRGHPLRAALFTVRERLGDALEAALPEPQAALAQAILTGRRSALPAGLNADLRATGTSHLVAISGYNVSIVAGLVLGSLAWLLGRRRAAALALVTIVAYAFLAGMAPPVQRAAIMGGLYVIGAALGRPGGALVPLVVAAAAMTAAQPLLLRDISFQLSFAATVGLIALAPALRDGLRLLLERRGLAADGPLAALVDVTAVTLAAIAFTLPITAINFGTISLVAPLANVLVVPAFPAILVTSGLTALAGVIASPFGQALAWLAWAPAAYMTGAVRLLADIPLATVALTGLGLPHALGYYLGLGLLAWVLMAGRRRLALARLRGWLRTAGARLPSPRLPAAAAGALLALAAVFVWLLILNAPGERLSVTLLDVGQGDAILVRTPAGHKVLVDGGPSGEAISQALGRQLPFWDRHLHLVVLTHPQADHLAGLLEVLGRYRVDQVLASPAEVPSALFRAWREAVAEEGIPLRVAAVGQWVDLGGGAWLSVLYPPAGVGDANINNSSVVIKLRWGEVSFLLTGDVEEEAEQALVEEGDVRATVLKVAHHGSATSTTPAFLRAVRPLVAAISVGKKNTFGHPAPEVLRRLEAMPAFRTDRHGDVKVSTDGRRLWVEVQRR